MTLVDDAPTPDAATEPAPGVLDGARLSALHRTGLLDGGDDQALDRLTRVATRLLGVPVSLVSLVDSDRQVFASQQGLPDPWASAGETPLSHSFCQHTVKGEALVVSDAREDPLVATNKAVEDLQVIAYAGIPLTTSDGQTLGAFCAIDAKPREWSEDDLALLRDLASAAVVEIELRRVLRDGASRCPVTTLPTRDVVVELVRTRLEEEASPEEVPAVFAVGIDGFGRINDHYGHRVADGVLSAVGNRLRTTLRGGDAVGRLDGDVFCVLAGVASAPGAVQLAKRLRAAFAEPFPVAGTDVHVRVTIGVGVARALREHEDRDPAKLIDEAESAMRRAKASGRPFSAFDAGAHERAADVVRIEQELRRAIERNQLQLAFQPIVDLPTRKPIGAEALLRWNHPELGQVGPADFIPIAEQSDLILEIGTWVLEQACAQLGEWSRRIGHRVRLAINLSPHQLREPGLMTQVAKLLIEHDVHARQIAFEITEGVLLTDDVTTTRALRDLRQLGIRFHLDDFGTGYSSLSYLKRIPLDAVKIDRQFVKDLPFDDGDAGICEAIVRMAAALNLGVIAEGIETEGQAQMLRAFGCPSGQGFLFGRPAPA